VRSSRTRATLSTGAPTETVAIFGAGGLGHLALQYARIACATASCTTTSTSSSPWRCGPAPTWSWPASACRCIALLTRAGFSAPDALHFHRAPFGFLHGHVLNELQELAGNPDETDDLLRLGLHRLPITEFPLLRGLAPVLSAYDGAAELERGLDILLTGLATAVTPRPLPRNREPSHPASGRPHPGCRGTANSGASAGLLTSGNKVRSKQPSSQCREAAAGACAAQPTGEPVRPGAFGREDQVRSDAVPYTFAWPVQQVRGYWPAHDPTPAAVAWIAVAALTCRHEGERPGLASPG